jgi:tryptophan-rich hypothetical protein
MPKKQKFPHLIGSKWTALESTFGWRHFQVANRKNQGEWVFAELVSSCGDPPVRFWLNANILKDHRRWQPGWTTLQALGLAKEEPLAPLEEATVEPTVEPTEPTLEATVGATSHDPD